MPDKSYVFEVLQMQVAQRKEGGIPLVNYYAGDPYYTERIGYFDSLEKADEVLEQAKQQAKPNVMSISVVAHPLNVRWHRLTQYYGSGKTSSLVRECSREVTKSFPGTGKAAQIVIPLNSWKEEKREDWEHVLGEDIAENVKTWNQFPGGDW
jgi:hypothetical protein